jgi:hypothetical protein
VADRVFFLIARKGDTHDEEYRQMVCRREVDGEIHRGYLFLLFCYPLSAGRFLCGTKMHEIEGGSEYDHFAMGGTGWPDDLGIGCEGWHAYGQLVIDAAGVGYRDAGSEWCIGIQLVALEGYEVLRVYLTFMDDRVQDKSCESVKAGAIRGHCDRAVAAADPDQFCRTNGCYEIWVYFPFG